MKEMIKVPENTRKLFGRCLKLLAPPEDISVKEWADKNRVLTSESSKEIGKWETRRTPYMLEIYETITKDEVRQVTQMLASQLAKSESILNTILRYIDIDPCPMLMVQPTQEMASAFSKERLEPAIKACKVVSEKIKNANKRGSGDTVLHKMFTGGFIASIGTNSPSSLAARPIRLAFMDEVDRYPASSGKEGNPISLVKKRQTTFEDISKCIITGTPTIKNHSEIEKEYLNSSQGEWYLECPHCKKLQVLKFGNLKWEEEKPSSVKMKCEKCGELFTEKEWKKGNQETGRWIHKYPERLDNRGYHLNTLASVFRTWESIVKEFLEVKHDKEKLKSFINTVLAETWEEEIKDKFDYDKIYKRREKYNSEIPEQVLLLTAGVDIQNDWIAVEVVGHALEGTYGIQYKVFYGNPEEYFIWNELDEFLNKEFSYRSGKKIKIFATCIDTGGNHTQKVYQYVSPRQNSRRIIGIKGQGGDAVNVNNGFRLTKNGEINLLSIGVNALKDIVFGSLKIKRGRKGYCHFPSNADKGYDLEYFKALTAEVKSYKNKKVEWIKIRERNEALDCRNYALVPFYVFNIDLNLLAELSDEDRYELSDKGIVKTKNKNKKKSGIISKGVEL